MYIIKQIIPAPKNLLARFHEKNGNIVTEPAVCLVLGFDNENPRNGDSVCAMIANENDLMTRAEEFDNFLGYEYR